MATLEEKGKLEAFNIDAYNKVVAERDELRDTLEAIAPLGMYHGSISSIVSADWRRRVEINNEIYSWLRQAAGILDVPLEHTTEDLIEERVPDSQMQSVLLEVRAKMTTSTDEYHKMYEAARKLAELRYLHSPRGEEAGDD